MNDGCGQKLPPSYAQYNPDTSYWKMSQLSLEIPGLSEQSSMTFTNSGSMQNGQLYERPTLAHRMAVNGSTFWPTPRASMGGAWDRMDQSGEGGAPVTVGGLSGLDVHQRREQASAWLASEPDVDRLADGIPNQSHRLRCAGNAVVPAASEYMGKKIIDHSGSAGASN